MDDAMTKRMLDRCDLHWDRLPQNFFEAPFLGNGGLGAAVYVVEDRLSFIVNDSRYADHQTGEDLPLLFGRSRLPVGRLSVRTRGDLVGARLVLGLHDATLRGTVTTTRGVFTIDAYVHATEDLLVVDLDPAGGERVEVEFEPATARSPRLDWNTRPEGLATNPAPVVTGRLVEQDLVAGGRTATRWVTRRSTVLLTVAHTFPHRDASRVTQSTLEHAGGLGELRRSHRRWWHRLYRRSAVILPDARLQSFYWTQVYKIASATREDRPVMATTGPWLERTPWPATWWNLNTQLSYWMIQATGHRELDAVTRAISEGQRNLALNVPEQHRDDSALLGRTAQDDLRTDPMGLPGENLPDERLETGDLLWGLHNVWLTYRFTMDAAVLRDTLFPVLRRAVNLYLHVLEEDAEGELHIPTTYSPEYGTTRDANYDLSLLSWGCRTLLTVCDLLGEDDPKIPEWHRVVNRLTPAPQDDTGLRIGADLALQTSHRHYSHLLWFYPLHLFDPADPEHEQLLRTSLEHWLGMTGALQGYTLTGAASMYALLGEGDRSLELLDQLMDEYIRPNTMYAESGPVIETPLSAAQSIHDMLLTSWGDRLRIFPAVPTGWKEVSFDELRAEGGFRVSAVRSQGVTKEVRITSDAGEPLRVAPTGLPSPWVATDARSGRALRMHVEAGVADIALERGRTAVLRTRGDHHEPPRPVLPAAHHWGLPADKEDR